MIARILLTLALIVGASAPWAQGTGGDAPADEEAETFVINLRGADIATLAEQVSQITGRTLILDPAVTGEVTVLSSAPLDADGVWTLFQSILRSRGFAAVASDVVWLVVPEAEARTIGGSDPTIPDGSQDIVTEMVRLARLPSIEAVRVLRPLVAESGYIEALTDPNAVLITDTRANVDRIIGIAAAFDAQGPEEAEVIRLTFADAVTVGTAILDVLGTAGTGTGARLTVDPTSNILLVRGTPAEIEEVRSLAASLDVAPRRSPQEAIVTQVFRMAFGDAQVVADIIRGTVGAGTDITNAVAGDIGEGTAPGGEIDPATGLPVASSGLLAPDGPAAVAVQASIETNSVIVRGTAAQVSEIGALIAALDVRRPQVMIEAAIVEVSGDVAERLGVQLGIGAAAAPGLAATSFSNGGISLQGVLAAVGVPQSVVLSTGLTLAGGSDEFSILVQALAQSTQARLLSTPSVTTLDNEAATIVVGQNVPFRTGTFSPSGGADDPFTTIERRDVGITMSVVPRITAGGVVQLQIQQEVSSLVDANVEGAVDLITNTRIIDTTVLADDGGTIVLGGLISDDRLSSEGRVPGLSRVPVVGGLFRSRNSGQTARTLFVFLRPTILRDAHDVRAAAEDRFRRLSSADAPPPPQGVISEQSVRRLPLEIQGLY